MNALRIFRKLLRLLASSVYRQGLLKGVGAAIEHERLISQLRIGSVIDVGANKGQFSLVVRASHPNAQIFAVEPLSEASDTFTALFASDNNVKLFRCAAGPRSETLEINISGRRDSSSLLQITSAQATAFPGTERIDKREVPIHPLDELIDGNAICSPLLLKLDVQGYELEALKGMTRLLDQAEHVYLELSFDTLYADQPLASDVISWLSARGFDLRLVNDVSRSVHGIPIQADVLFTKR